MEKYSDLELKRELWKRGYEVYDHKNFALDFVWTLDDAITIYRHVKNDYYTENELSHQQLIDMLNKLISSVDVMKMISDELYKNIYDTLFED